ncbi:MAG: hypothetical protein ACO1RT_13335 [Planctomycetaceae bacterium]
MMIRKLCIASVCLLVSFLADASSIARAQSPDSVKRRLQISPRSASEFDTHFHLLPAEEEQEPGNAVPVLLRMVYEQQPFMKDVYPKLHEYAEMSIDDPRWKEFHFDRFAAQIIRAGSMSDADWQYPLRSDRPYMILLPDVQSQRQLVGHGMTAWIKQRLSQGKLDEALLGIKSQLACGRHCAATPVVVCHLVGLAIANRGFDNLELALESADCPNMYWALATLPPTLQELGPMLRWELWATPTRLNEPLPSIGNQRWVEIANKFVELYGEASTERYTPEEGEALQRSMDDLAKKELAKTVGFSQAEIERMTKEERIMRWIYLRYLQFRSRVEPLAFQSPQQVIAAKLQVEAADKQLLADSGAKSSPYPVSLPQAILACRTFERRAKFLQTIEAIRDHAGRNDGALPAKLEELHLPAPDDPFTQQPFVYELHGDSARLTQAAIEGFPTAAYDYELTTK